MWPERKRSSQTFSKSFVVWIIAVHRFVFVSVKLRTRIWGQNLSRDLRDLMSNIVWRQNCWYLVDIALLTRRQPVRESESHMASRGGGRWLTLQSQSESAAARPAALHHCRRRAGLRSGLQSMNETRWGCERCPQSRQSGPQQSVWWSVVKLQCWRLQGRLMLAMFCRLIMNN